MNASTVRANFVALATPVQKLIAADLRLVLVAADYDGLLLDVYVRFDDGFELAAITQHGQKVDLCPALSNCCIDHFTNWVEIHMPSEAEMRAEAELQSRIDQREWDGAMRSAPDLFDSMGLAVVEFPQVA